MDDYIALTSYNVVTKRAPILTSLESRQVGIKLDWLEEELRENKSDLSFEPEDL